MQKTVDKRWNTSWKAVFKQGSEIEGSYHIKQNKPRTDKLLSL